MGGANIIAAAASRLLESELAACSDDCDAAYRG